MPKYHHKKVVVVTTSIHLNGLLHKTKVIQVFNWNVKVLFVVNVHGCMAAKPIRNSRAHGENPITVSKPINMLPFTWYILIIHFPIHPLFKMKWLQNHLLILSLVTTMYLSYTVQFNQLFTSVFSENIFKTKKDSPNPFWCLTIHCHWMIAHVLLLYTQLV